MVYDKPLELNDLIAYAKVFDQEGSAIVNGQKLYKSFKAYFWLKDNGKAFRVAFWIRVENETPVLYKIEHFGTGEFPLWFLEKLGDRGTFTPRQKELINSGEMQGDVEPIKAKHLTLISRFSYQLITKATVLSINHYKASALNDKGIRTKLNDVYTSKELQALEKEISKSVRRNVPTDAMLRDVAKRYKKAEKNGEPLYNDIMRHYTISERRARELITMCRRHNEKLLPKKKAGRPSVNETPTRKKGK